MRQEKANWFAGCRQMAAILMVLFATPVLPQTITLSVPDTAAPSRSLVKLPIWVSDVSGLGIVSLSLKLVFDPNVLDALGANSKGTISQAWGNPTTSDSTGQLTLVMVGATPLSGHGILTYIFFDVIGAKNDTTSIKFKMVSVNDGQISAVVSSSKFTTLEAEPSPNARFSIPDTSGDSGSLIELPIRVSDLSKFHIDSLRIGISYNKYVMQALEVTTNKTLAQNWQVRIEMQLPGNLAFVLKGSTSFPDSGVLCRIRCELKGNPGMATPVHFQNIACYNDTMRIATHDGKVSIAGGSAAQALVSIPDISADSANTVTVPIFVSPLSQQDAVSAVSIALTFDPQVIAYKSYSVTNTLLDGWFCSANVPSPGLLRFGAFSASYAMGQGVLVEFVFQVVGRPAMQTPLAFSEMVFNEGSPSVTAFNGVFTVNYVIPVELIGFKAEQVGNAVLLIWSTATESNNYGFEI
ncbi:MAG: cohesin domain-containing protein, partial [candidate division KSB1 bacterium]|nr:cohesin domain-containing protein [candidate division KSB1 bacterium]